MTDTILSAAVVQRPTMKIKLAPGRKKVVTMPVDGDVTMGMRDEIAAHYKVPPAELTPHATTLDYLIAATGACLTSTFAARLVALGQDISDEGLGSVAEGVIVEEKGVLRVQSIHLSYSVRRSPGVPVGRSSGRPSCIASIARSPRASEQR